MASSIATGSSRGGRAWRAPVAGHGVVELGLLGLPRPAAATAAWPTCVGQLVGSPTAAWPTVGMVARPHGADDADADVPSHPGQGAIP